MYNLYVKKMNELQKYTVSYEKYRKQFRKYKLSFHKPKKDLCKRCVTYAEMNAEEKIVNEEQQKKHLKRKDLARLSRDADKEAAQNDPHTLAFNFDLEAVLNTPKGAAGLFFYLRKLALYNLTVYNLGNQDVDAYLWDETQGKRGSIEIATCIFKYITSHPEIKHVRSYG